ncbi:MAG: hypothetical protein LUO93_04750, partial [Methanomicrobiales archaeon]|nr:hypothetical protein [Methanomicrobiales archaeon]
PTFQQPFAFDITGQVQSWFSGATANHGLEFLFSDCAFWFACSSEYMTMYSTNSTTSKPFVTVQYQLPTATVYTAFVCSSGPCSGEVASGLGLPSYLFSVTLSENNGTTYPVPRPDIILSNLSSYDRLNVSDFWGNRLYTGAKIITSTPFIWRVDIPFALLNSYNMRDAYTNLTVQPAGGTPMIVFLPPRGWYTFPLNVGTTYFLNFTLYNANFGILGYINISRKMPSYGLNYLVNGTSISEVRQVQSGQWLTGNTTQGLAGATGNLVGGLYQFNLFKPIGPWIPWLGFVSAWLILFFIEIGAAVAWAFAYGSRVRRSGLKLANAEKAVKGLPVRANA